MEQKLKEMMNVAATPRPEDGEMKQKVLDLEKTMQALTEDIKEKEKLIDMIKDDLKNAKIKANNSEEKGSMLAGQMSQI